MSTTQAGPSSLGNSIFTINRTRILVVLSLILTWTIARILPNYKQSIRDTVTDNFNDVVEHIPAVKVDWHPKYDPKGQFNSSKLALLIEGRPLPHLVPQLLHMMSVVPPEWRFMFIGTNTSVATVRRSFATQYHEQNGKLDVLAIPEPWSVEDKEHVFRMLTDIRFYDEYLPDVEHLLKFESDSIMCSNSPDSINDWLEYDWAGASRTQNDRFAGNGGLSLRKISVVKTVLGFNVRHNDTDPEDEWYGKRIIALPDAKVATAQQEEHFAVEDIWYDKPLGFHVPDGGQRLADAVWKDPDRRKANFDYCPELVIVMPMKLERERCEGDNHRGSIVHS